MQLTKTDMKYSLKTFPITIKETEPYLRTFQQKFKS